MKQNLHIPHPDERLTMSEATERYKVHRRIILSLIESGSIRAWQFGRKYQIDKSSADKAFLASEVKPMRGR